MASAITMPTCSFCLSSLSQSSNTRKQFVWNISNSAVSLTQVSNFQFSKWVPQLGLCQFSQWDGLKNLGISTPQLTVKMGTSFSSMHKCTQPIWFYVAAALIFPRVIFRSIYSIFPLSEGVQSFQFHFRVFPFPHIHCC